MNLTASVTPGAAWVACELPEAFQAAVRRITWRVTGATLCISAAVDGWWLIYAGGTGQGAAYGYPSEVLASLLMAFSIMFTTFVADELVARGARRMRAYACAVVAGSALAALVHWPVHQWLPVAPSDDPPLPATIIAVSVFCEYLIWGGIVVFIYVHHHAAMLASARMSAAQVQRAQAARRALESRLQALQARVEPQFLFNTLARVRDAYEVDPARGSSMLDDLIVYLRASLPHLRESTSTLAQELDLVRTYWSIMREHLGARLTIAADAAARSARMPAMVLLPLIDRLCRAGSSMPHSAVDIAAREEAGLLRLQI